MDTSDTDTSSTTPPSTSPAEQPTDAGSQGEATSNYSDVQFNPSKTAYHERLNIPLDASTKQIRKAGKKATNLFHPDNDTKYANESEFIKISEAKKTLSDSDLKPAYRLFCLNFGLVDGTEMFETWRNRGEPRSAPIIVEKRTVEESLQFRPLSELSDHLPLPDQRESNTTPHRTDKSTERGEEDNDSEISDKLNEDSIRPGATPEKTPETQQQQQSTNWDEPGDDSNDEKVGGSSPSLHSGNGSVSTPSIGEGAQPDVLLDDYIPKIVVSSVDSDSLSVSNRTFAGIDYIAISGFVPDMVLLFNLSTKTLSSQSGESIPDVSWSEELGKKEYTFEYQDESIVIALQKKDSISPESTRVEDSTVDKSTDVGLTTRPTYSQMVKNVIWFVYDETPVWLIGGRIALIIGWFAVVLSGILTPLGAVGAALLMIPLMKTGIWVLSAYTVYYIFPVGIIEGSLPTGGVNFTAVLFSLIAATAVTAVVQGGGGNSDN